MKLRMTFLAVALTTAVANAGPPKEMSPADAQKWITLFDKVVDAVVTNRAECGHMAKNLDTTIDANQPTIAATRTAMAKGMKLPASAQQHMMDGVQRIMSAMDKCGRDAKVGAAFQRLDLRQRP